MQALILALLSTAAARPPVSSGQPLEFLARQLVEAKDARARAQAAIMLGDSDDPLAASPLCSALYDASSLVKTSAIHSLRKLGTPRAQECLTQHRNDPDPEVQAENAKALARLGPLPGQARSVLYVLLSAAAVGPGDSKALSKLTRDELGRRLRNMANILAPEHEDKAHALALMRANDLKAVDLRATATRTATGLTLRVQCFSFPEKQPVGELTVSAAGDKSEELLSALAPRVLEGLFQTCHWSN